jgi:hypothetical protein
VHFAKARSFTPHPVITFNLAQAEARAGLFIEAEAHFAEVATDAKSDATLKKRASAASDEARASIAHVTVIWPGYDHLDISVDGKPKPLQDEGFDANPGRHQLRVAPQGHEPVEQFIELAPGERLQLRVSGTTRTMDVILPAQPQVAPPEEDAPKAAERTGLESHWFFVAAGGTAVVLGLAVASGLDTVSAHDDYKRDLPTLSEREARRRLDDGHDRELRTNLLWGAGGLCALGTVALGVFWTDWAPKAEAEVGLGIAPGRVTLTGRF